MDGKELFVILERRSQEELLEEVQIILEMISPEFNTAPIISAFNTTVRLFMGKYPGYRECNTKYHDLNHTLTTFIAMARLIHGAILDGKKLSRHNITVGLISALFHDAGYIQKEHDTEGTGAKYTSSHVQLSMDFLRLHGDQHNLSKEDIEAGRTIILCTDTIKPLRDIPFPSDEIRLLGNMLAVADINAQIAERIYLEKLLYLYYEFKEGKIPGYESKEELLQKTISFYNFIADRLQSVSDMAIRFFKLHFSKRWNICEDLYSVAIEKHRDYLVQIMKEPDPLSFLKRGGIVNDVRGYEEKEQNSKSHLSITNQEDNMPDSLYDFKKNLNEKGIFFCLSGPISQALLVELGDTLKQKMQLDEASSSTVLRVFSMVVEKAQNIIHYSAEKIPSTDSTEQDELKLGIIAVGYKDNHYFVSCGNLLENKNVEKLREKLTRLQKMNKEEIKQYYKEQRKKGGDEGSKGAGLGLIEIARKADKPIEFDFKKIDEKFSFFSSKIVI